MTPLKKAAGSGQESRAILVVDSLDAVLAIAREFLESAGYAVLTARSTREAAKIAMQYAGRIELLIADPRAAGTGADRFVRRMKKLHPRMRVIVMSALFRGSQAQKRFENVDSDFVWKPFTKRELIFKVNRLLARGE